MRKFKVGDKVKLVSDTFQNGESETIDNQTGKTGVVVREEVDYYYKVAIDGNPRKNYYDVSPRDLELIKPKIKYKVPVTGLSVADEYLPHRNQSNVFYSEYATWPIGYNTSITNNSPKKGNQIMTNIAKAIKELTISADDKLLRKHGLQNENGEWTETAVDVMDQLLLDERKADLIAKVKEVEALEAKAKK